MTNMKDVADKANVSRATVSRVLAGHPSVKPETRKLVLHWVKKLNYQPNIIAQTLAGNKTNIIGVILPEIANPFFAGILAAIENQASYQGYNIILCCTNKNKDTEKSILNQLKSRKIDGIICVPISSTHSYSYYKQLDIPVVTITKKMQGFSSVSISHYDGGKKIAQHFLDLGYQNIGYVGPTKTSTSAIKFAGFRDYLKKNGLELSDIIENVAPETIENITVYDTVIEYISKNGLNSDALFANDDATACDTIKALCELGYRVPQDVAVAGFDNSLISKKMNPSISSLSQPLIEMGKKAVDILIESINSDNTKIEECELDTRVISRESTIARKKIK